MSQVLVFTPKRFGDSRGWFSETFNHRREVANGIADDFVQDNQSVSWHIGTIRGIHFQAPPHAQAKLVRCTRGCLLDVVVDLRRGSPTYGQYVAVELSFDNGCSLYIPKGFGHAFVTREPDTEISYKVDDFYDSSCDGGIRWDCPRIGIDWCLGGISPTVSEKDARLPSLDEWTSPFGYDGVPLGLVQIN